MSRTLLKIAVALILVALIWRVLLGNEDVEETA
jgi:hypothetical protein